MRIDSHQHYWQLSRGDYNWMGPDTPAVLVRDRLPPDLATDLREHRIDQTVVVQAADSVAETEFLLRLATREPSIAGVVGWLDVEGEDFSARLADYAARPKFVGIRPMLQDLPDDYLLRPRVIGALRELKAQDVALDFLVLARQLPAVLRALDFVPGLRAVIDHIAKPDIRGHAMHPWREHVAAAAAHPQVYCKLSGMITEADHSAWTADDLRPYVEHVVGCFGWDRVMFGSDWPVCLMAGSYGQVVGALESALEPHLTPDRNTAAFGGNATQFYRLK